MYAWQILGPHAGRVASLRLPACIIPGANRDQHRGRLVNCCLVLQELIDIPMLARAIPTFSATTYQHFGKPGFRINKATDGSLLLSLEAVTARLVELQLLDETFNTFTYSGMVRNKIMDD